MHSFLKQEGWKHVSVVGLVVLSKGRNALRGDDPNAHKVFGLHKSLLEAMTGRQYVFRSDSPTLSCSDVQRLRNIILNSHVADAERRISHYRILGQQEGDYYVDLEAEDLEFPGRKVRIKQYDLPEVGSQKDLEKAVSRFKRDMAALLEAGWHPNLVMPLEFRRDASSDERYYLITEWPGGQTLAHRIAEGSIALAEQFRILKDIAAALAHCHARRVIHRNLTPDAIYLMDDGGVKVGDFDFAKVPTVSSTLARTGRRLVTGRHVSPEQAFHASDVDARSDVYSLGAVWYDMLFHPEPDEPLRRGRVAQAPLSDEGREILLSMLAERRSDRLSSMVEVQNWLNLLADGLP